MIQVHQEKSTLAKAAQSVTLEVEGLSTLIIELTGTFSAILIFEYTVNGTDWYILTAALKDSGALATGATNVGVWSANVAGLLKVRVRCSAYTSGTIGVYLRSIAFPVGSGASIGGGVSSSVSVANTPAIISTSTALAANANRKGFMIQNVGTNPLFVLLGTGASTTVFHAVLKGGTGNSDGLGSSMSQFNGVIYTGQITIAGTSPLYVVIEL